MFNKFNLKQLKSIIKEYNLHTSIKGYSKMKKADIITEIKKHLDIDEKYNITIKNVKTKIITPIKTPIKKKETQVLNNIYENEFLKNGGGQDLYMELRYKYRNHPAMKLNNEIEEIKKRLERNDYEGDKKAIKEAKKKLEKLESLRDSDNIYLMYNGLPYYYY